MKTRRFDFNWRPLQLQISFAAEGSVPDKQTYCDDTGEFTPDYTLTPLTIQPAVSILDKDEVLAAGCVNDKLANIKWYEVVGGVKTLITTDNASYEVTASGANAGRISVKRNSEPKNPITLVFYAEYVDSRTGQILTIQGSYLITCGNATSQLRIELDAAQQSIYNPLADERAQTVTATVWRGSGKCQADLYTLVWEVRASNGAWRTVGSDTVMDYDVTANEDGSVTIDKWLMGDELQLRCRAKYSADGDTDSVELTDATPTATASFIRRIPAYEYDFTGVPYNIPAGLLQITPTAVIRTTNGEVADAEKELLPLWYAATNKASGSLSYSLVAHGKEPVLSTAPMDSIHGAVIGLDVKDRGSAGAFTDGSDSSVLTDSDGNILIIH